MQGACTVCVQGFKLFHIRQCWKKKTRQISNEQALKTRDGCHVSYMFWIIMI